MRKIGMILCFLLIGGCAMEMHPSADAGQNPCMEGYVINPYVSDWCVPLCDEVNTCPGDLVCEADQVCRRRCSDSDPCVDGFYCHEGYCWQE